jgi:hypothetical protein
MNPAQYTEAMAYIEQQYRALHIVYIGRQRRIPKSVWLAFVRPGNLVPTEEQGQRERTPVPAI